MDKDKQANNAWRILFLLFLANLFNFFDRTIPAVLTEPIRKEFGLSDTELGLLAGGFTVVYALAGIPLGRLADRASRKSIMGWGLAAWSLLTGASGAAWNYTSFFFVRLAVGVGEASYAPAASAMIGDLFPANKRSRAIGIFMLGLPIGLVLAFFTIGAMAKAFGSWRAPFFVAMVPGLVLAVFMFFIREPARGAAETQQVTEQKIDRPLRKILSIRTMWAIIVAGITLNLASYAANAFLVPLVQRYFQLPLASAGMATGVIVGISGLVGLTLGALIADKLHQINERARLIYGALSMFGAAALVWFALRTGAEEFTAFVALFALGWLLQYNFYNCAYPAIQDIVEPRLRATAMAVFFAVLYVLGGSAGPLITGAWSDHAAKAAMAAAGATQMTDHFRGIGLHEAMVVVPIALLVTGVALLFASRTFSADAAAMRNGRQA
ncbi:MAG: MFS transporter [Roseateles sp.]|uniref:spinster family MFS transporter n=1 Tax=Roseateles sp. TaxID=1971397 RepID=UPI0039ED0570